MLFSRTDGWGNDFTYKNISAQGLIDVFAWCDLSPTFQETLTFGPSLPNEELQISLPGSFYQTKMYLASVMVRESC